MTPVSGCFQISPATTAEPSVGDWIEIDAGSASPDPGRSLPRISALKLTRSSPFHSPSDRIDPSRDKIYSSVSAAMILTMRISAAIPSDVHFFSLSLSENQDSRIDPGRIDPFLDHFFL